MTEEEAIVLSKLGEKVYPIVRSNNCWGSTFYVVFFLVALDEEDIVDYEVFIDDIFNILLFEKDKTPFLKVLTDLATDEEFHAIFDDYLELDFDCFKVFVDFNEGLQYLIQEGKLSKEDAVLVRLSI